MRSILHGLILVTVLSCCTRKHTVSEAMILPASEQKSYLALGDSYTIGQSVPMDQNFPNQTRTVLNSLGVNMTAPEIIATTGWTTDDLNAAIDVRRPQGPYDVVSLLIGVNDQYQRHDTIGYRQRFTNLLNRAILFAGSRRNHVFVVSIPDYSVTPFASFSDTATIRRQIGWFNDINRQVTEQYLCTWLDITPSTREALYDPTLIANDGLHPSGKEYKKWADRLAVLMKQVIN